MSGENEGSNYQKSSTPQAQSQAQLAQDLNFSFNDMLSSNVNYSSSHFQAMTHSNSNSSNSSNNHDVNMTSSYAHLPAELQALFNSNDSDGLLSHQGENGTDASSLLPGNLSSLWDHHSTTGFLNSSQGTAVTSSPMVIPTQQQQQQQQPQQQPESSATLLDNITAQLPPDRKDKFIRLFRELQSGSVTAPDFLTRAKTLLGQQQYQQLEDLKNKPSQFVSNMTEEDMRKRTLSSSQIRQEDSQRANNSQLKRAKTELNNNNNIPLNQMVQQFNQIPPPQNLQQQQQLQHLQMQLQQQHMQMLQRQHMMQQSQHVLTTPPVQNTTPQHIIQQSPNNNATTPIAVFKTPAMPGSTNTSASALQVPPRSNSNIALTVPTKSNDAAKTQPSGTNTSSAPTNTNTGGERTDYDTLTDVMGYAGVDLREEEQHFLKEDTANVGPLPDGVDRSKVQDFMNTLLLQEKILKYAKSTDLKQVDSDSISYIALATQDRIRTVMENMVLASKHRTLDPFTLASMKKDQHPMFKIQVKNNIKSQLEAIEKVSRQVELDLDPIDEDEDDEDNDDMSTKEKGWYSKQSKKPLVWNKQDNTNRKVTVQDAIFVMERDVQGGRGCVQKSLLKAYSEYLS